MKKVVVLVSFFFSVLTLQAQKIKSVKVADLQKIIAESKTPLIITFFATWCQPCLEELPYFLDEVKNHNTSANSADSLSMLLVSMDFKEAFPSKIAAFAKKRNFNVPVAWLNETNADYFCPKIDATWSGAIPATLFINNKSGYRNFVEEQISHERLKKEIMAILEKR